MMISRRGELDLNHIPPSPAAAEWDSVKEGLKQAMLQHEIVFKNQVRELHRLYWTQKNLMNEVAHAAAKDCNGLIEEKIFSSMRSLFPILQSNSLDMHMHGRKNIDVQMPLNSFVGGFGRAESSSRSLELRGYAGYGTAAGVEGPKVDCGTNETNRGPSSLNAHCFIDLEAPVEMVVDEEPSAIISLGFDTLADNAADASCSQATVLFDSSSLKRMQNDYLHMSIEEHSCAGQQREKRLKETSINSFADVQESGLFRSVNQSGKKQQSTSKHLNIDLNIAQDDEPINGLPDTKKAFSSPSTSSSVVIIGDMWRESSGKYQNGSELSNVCPGGSLTVVPDVVVHVSENVLPDACKDNLPSSIQGSEGSTTIEENSWKYEKSEVENAVGKSDQNSVFNFCRRPIERCSTAPNKVTEKCTNLVSTMNQQQLITARASKFHTSISSNEIENNCLHASAGSNNLLPSMIVDPGENQIQESEEDTVSSCAIALYKEHQVELGKLSDCKKLEPSDGNYGFMVHNNGVKELVSLSTSENYRSTVDSSKVHCSEQVPTTNNSDCVCSRDESCGNGISSNQEDTKEQQGQVVALDLLIMKAAETLISFSENSACSTGEVDFYSNRHEELEFEHSKDHYKVSSDSFEWKTMNLEELKDDGNSFICRQIVKETGKESCGIKLPRGRGMRDFQKDILPGLVSLSRKEICEDIHRINLHPRKNRSRRANENKLSMPLRNRRTRQHNVCMRL